MPWRAAPGEPADPYKVWLSEIMLQQTTVAAVVPYFERFVARFPDVGALAAAELEEVLRLWAGLGYYARARNLHRCARAVAARGGFPEALAELSRLPGIGAYTAAAVASIAFGRPAVAVDGNVERVAARVFAIEAPLPASRPALAAAARRLGDDPAAKRHPADFTQALFDLGATLCTPRRPACLHCPWQDRCAGRARGLAAELPRRSPKPARPRRHGAHFFLEDEGGAVLFRRRPEAGLLGGMLELPGTDWRAAPWTDAEALACAPQAAAWRHAGTVRHVFTHFELLVTVFAARVVEIVGPGLRVAAEGVAGEALPSLMRRCIAIARESAVI